MPLMDATVLLHALALATCAAVACAAGASSVPHVGAPRALSSPDGRLRVELTMPEPGGGDTPRWSATFGGKPLLAECRLSLTAAGEGDLLAGASVRSERRRGADKPVRVLFGRAATARDRYNELRLTLETPRRRRLDVTFRCYDDAVAVRYAVPKQAGWSRIAIADEGTSFAVAGNPQAYAQYLENYRTPHEHNVTVVPYREIAPDTLLDMPLTFYWPDGTCVAVTEAALRRYAGMSLMRPKDGPERLECRLTPREDGMKVVRPLPMETPWRVALVGDRAGALLESNTLYCLNDPNAIGDTSWIRPGKLTFSWWNGDVYDGKRGQPILSLPMQEKYIDFCARNGIAFQSVIADETVTPWYHQSNPGVVPGPDTDVTRPRDDLDLLGIRRYAESKGVRLWTWVHQAALRGRVEEAFAAFERMGWSGMMVDFFDHDDQASVEHAEAILQAAARHHILIHLHGVWKPTGWQRTYPNLMNHEGALNLEYLKWSDRCTPEHDLRMAFTRLVAGPMDYHLGGFRAVPRAAFQPHSIAPNVLGTRCHMLAMYVCWDNPSPMVADYPTAYEGQPGFDFLRAVPTWWDETRVPLARVGELLVTARRRGRAWYVGGLAGATTQTANVPLAFLGPGRWTLRLWRDAPDTTSHPNALATETRSVTSADTLMVELAAGGGFVADVQPLAHE